MSTRGDDARYGYAIDAVENAARVLRMLTTNDAIRAADVARELSVARSTAHRMVSTLQQTGFLRRHADKSYSPGPALIELGFAVIGARDLASEIAPTLNRLAASTGETAHFLVRDGDEVHFVAATESTQVIRAASRVGSRLPAHVTAAGRALLATLTEEQVLELYPVERLPVGGTQAALHTRAGLLADLAAVREAGHAVNLGQSEPGLVAIAVAVRDSVGVTQGAVVVSGPQTRLEPRVASALVALREAASRFEGQRARS